MVARWGEKGSRIAASETESYQTMEKCNRLHSNIAIVCYKGIEQWNKTMYLGQWNKVRGINSREKVNSTKLIKLSQEIKVRRINSMY